MQDRIKPRQQWFVIRQLVSREMKRRYSRSKLGILWSVLNPLLTMAVMSVLFTQMFRREIDYYPLYLLTGNILWGLFSGATNTAMTAVVDNRALLMKIKLSKETFPLSRVYLAAVNFFYTIVAYVLVLAVFRIRLTITVLAVPFIVLCLILFSAGVGYILCVLYVFFGDIKHLYSVVLLLWMYMSAIFYPVEAVPAAVQRIIRENPVFNYIQCMRNCVLYGKWPEPGEFLRMLLWAVCLYGLGHWIFKRSENKMMIYL